MSSSLSQWQSLSFASIVASRDGLLGVVVIVRVRYSIIARHYGFTVFHYSCTESSPTGSIYGLAPCSRVRLMNSIAEKSEGSARQQIRRGKLISLGTKDL